MGKVIEIKVPEYTVKKKPNYIKIGKKVDKLIEKNFSDGKYIVRAIGSQDHPKLSVNELIKKIKKLGTDKYDSKRKEVCHDEFSMYNHDMHAGKILIKNSKLVIPKSYKYKTEFGDFVYHFYEHTPIDRGYSVRIDIFLIYDAKKLERAKKIKNKNPRWARKQTERCLYKFKDPKNKKEALVGIINIL